MLGSSYIASPTWLYLPGATLVLNDRYAKAVEALRGHDERQKTG